MTFEQLANRKEMGKLAGVARNRLKPELRNKAEDIAQEAYMVAWERNLTVEPIEFPKTYIIRTIENMCRQHALIAGRELSLERATDGVPLPGHEDNDYISNPEMRYSAPATQLENLEKEEATRLRIRRLRQGIKRLDKPGHRRQWGKAAFQWLRDPRSLEKTVAWRLRKKLEAEFGCKLTYMRMTDPYENKSLPCASQIAKTRRRLNNRIDAVVASNSAIPIPITPRVSSVAA